MNLENEGGEYYKIKHEKYFPSADSGKPEQHRNGIAVDVSKVLTKTKAAIRKRCKLSGLKKLIISKASEVAICKGCAWKLYRGKYYRQRLIFESPGEPYILEMFSSEFFVKLLKCRYNELRSVAFLEHEKVFGEYGEWIKMQRLLFKASDSAKLFEKGLYPKLLNWLKNLKGYMPRSRIRHRDITLEHILWSHEEETFKLIDFAIAVPVEGWKYAREDDPFDDQVMIDNCITKANDQWEKAKVIYQR